MSDKFGFGMMNAGGMVKRALTWKNVDEQIKCNISVISAVKPPRLLMMTQSIDVLVDVSLSKKYIKLTCKCQN